MVGWLLALSLGVAAIVLMRRMGNRNTQASLSEPDVIALKSRVEELTSRGTAIHDLSDSTDDMRARMSAFSWGTVMLTAFCVPIINWFTNADEWMLIGMVIFFLSMNMRDDFGGTFVGFMRSEVRRMGDIVVYVIAAAVKIAITAGGVWLLFRAATHFNEHSYLMGAALLLSALATLSVAHIPAVWLIRLGVFRRRRSENLMASRDTVLLLRSFQDDGIRFVQPAQGGGLLGSVLPVRVESLERLVAAGVGTRQVVAIGKPGEKLPALGAVRTYWANEEWQPAIQAAANRCRMIVVFGGATAGLAWELDRVRAWGLMGKTVLLMPRTPGVSMQSKVSQVRAALGYDEDQALPPLQGGEEGTTEDEVRLSEHVVALRFDQDERIRYYVSSGQDWAAYLAAVHRFLEEFESRDGKAGADAGEGELPTALEPVPTKDLWRLTKVLQPTPDGRVDDPAAGYHAAVEAMELLDRTVTPGTFAGLATIALRCELQDLPGEAVASKHRTAWLNAKFVEARATFDLALQARRAAPLFGSTFVEKYGTVMGGFNVALPPSRVQLEAAGVMFEVAHLLGEPQLRRVAVESAIGVAERRQDRNEECTWQLRLAEASVALGDLTAAEGALGRAQSLANRQGDVLSLAESARLQVVIHDSTGDHHRAAEARGRLVQLQNQLGGGQGRKPAV